MILKCKYLGNVFRFCSRIYGSLNPRHEERSWFLCERARLTVVARKFAWTPAQVLIIALLKNYTPAICGSLLYVTCSAVTEL